MQNAAVRAPRTYNEVQELSWNCYEVRWTKPLSGEIVETDQNDGRTYTRRVKTSARKITVLNGTVIAHIERPGQTPIHVFLNGTFNELKQYAISIQSVPRHN